MRRKGIAKVFWYCAVFTAAVFFVVIFGGANILKGYIKSGIGDCSKIPVLCKVPLQDLSEVKIDKEYTEELIPYVFPKMSLSAPRGFMVVQELHKKPYYKKRINRHKESVIYVFRQEPGYFLKLFPQVKSRETKDNYDFIKRLAFANTEEIKSLNDAFFIILKSIFTADIGNQNNAIMASFSIRGKKGFITYNLLDKEYYFDCNLVSDDGDFFKLYIKDLNASLDIKEVLAIASTLAR